MEEEKWYGILWQFLWQRRRTAALLAAFAGIYAVVFYLYDMETEAVLYAGGLCVLLGAVVLCVSFFFYYNARSPRHWRRRTTRRWSGA